VANLYGVVPYGPFIPSNLEFDDLAIFSDFLKTKRNTSHAIFSLHFSSQ
jgi:hypothetical protein